MLGAIPETQSREKPPVRGSLLDFMAPPTEIVRVSHCLRDPRIPRGFSSSVDLPNKQAARRRLWFVWRPHGILTPVLQCYQSCLPGGSPSGRQGNDPPRLLPLEGWDAPTPAIVNSQAPASSPRRGSSPLIQIGRQIQQKNNPRQSGACVMTTASNQGAACCFLRRFDSSSACLFISAIISTARTQSAIGDSWS